MLYRENLLVCIENITRHSRESEEGRVRKDDRANSETIGPLIP